MTKCSFVFLCPFMCLSVTLVMLVCTYLTVTYVYIHTYIHRLNVRHNQIKDEGLTALLEGVKSNASLNKLLLWVSI